MTGHRHGTLKEEAARIPWGEWLVAALGLLFLGAALAVILDSERRDDDAPPDIRVRVTDVRQAGGRWLVRFEATNAGDQAAAQVEIAGVLSVGDSTVEESAAVLDYLPPRSPREGGLFFSRDPRAASLELRPRGYQLP